MQEFQQLQGTVTHLFRQDASMRDPIILDLLTYWERLRDGRIAPLRSEIDPREIRDALDHTFILEHTSQGDFRFRLAGMRLCEMKGMELRGMPAPSLFEMDHRIEIQEILDALLKEPKIVEIDLSAANGKARMLLLPMCNDKGVVNRVLGCISTQSNRTSAPNHYSILKTKITRIVSQQKISAQTLSAGFNDTQAECVPASNPPRPDDSFELRTVRGGKESGPGKTKKTQPNLRLIKND